MKKKKLYFAILLAFIFCAIATAYYYRPVFVSKKEENSPKEIGSNLEEKTQKTAKQAHFVITGDNLIHENVLNFANLNAGADGNRNTYSSGFDFKPLYAPVENEIKNADYAICMQSSLIGANDAPEALSGYPTFNSPTKLSEDLISIGFDGFNFANNHIMDMGAGGLKNAIQYWKKQNAASFGFYEKEEEFSDPENKIILVNGIKIGILAYTAATNLPYYGNDFVLPYYTVNKTAIQKEMLKEQISRLKEKADLVIVLMNWGNGEAFEASEHQRETARCLAEFGADLIVGTGPKVMQKIETIEVEGRENGVICAYSLGNFMGTMEYMQNLLGGMISFDVIKEEDRAKIRNFVFLPTIIHYDEKISNISVYPLKDYSEELYRMHGSNLTKGFGEYSWLFQTVQKQIPSEYLPAYFRS